MMTSSARSDVRLLTYNIREGGVGRAEQIAEVISAARPDVVALQEARNPAVVERIAELAGFRVLGVARLRTPRGSSARVPVLAARVAPSAADAPRAARGVVRRRPPALVRAAPARVVLEVERSSSARASCAGCSTAFASS